MIWTHLSLSLKNIPGFNIPLLDCVPWYRDSASASQVLHLTAALPHTRTEWR
jgi:hypothetical protein